MTGPVAPVTIALVGTRGFGSHHLERLRRLEEEGRTRLIGVVDVVEPEPELQGIWHRSLGELLAQVAPQIVIVATPIDTHVPLALEALAAGCDVYLEKPPVPALEDLGVLQEAAERAGRRVQVGFQAVGGGGIAELRALAADGAGVVRIHGAWLRDRAYYARSRWAGKRRLEGRRVADGVATNPLAHAVHAGLAIAGMTRVEDVATVTSELRRGHDIEADDTTFLRIAPAGDGPVVVATLTAIAPQQSAPWVEVDGARLYYTEDLTVREGERRRHGREDLLENLLDHLADRSVPLISPLESTGAFTAVLEAIQTAPDPLPIEPVTWVGEGEAAHPEVEGLEETLIEALRSGRPFSELGVPWARADAVARWENDARR